MIEKIDKFIDKYLNWNVLKNLLLGELAIMPWVFLSSMYNIPLLFKVIMFSSIGISISFFTKATMNILKS